MDVLSVDGAGEALGAQARTVAGGAELVSHVGSQAILRPVAVAFGVASLQIGNDAFEGFFDFASAHSVGNRFVRAVEENFFKGGGQLVERGAQVDPVVVGDSG